MWGLKCKKVRKSWVLQLKHWRIQCFRKSFIIIVMFKSKPRVEHAGGLKRDRAASQEMDWSVIICRAWKAKYSLWRLDGPVQSLAKSANRINKRGTTKNTTKINGSSHLEYNVHKLYHKVHKLHQRFISVIVGDSDLCSRVCVMVSSANELPCWKCSKVENHAITS